MTQQTNDRQFLGAVLQFLQSEYPNTAQAFLDEISQKGKPSAIIPKEPKLLSRKWSVVNRLQFKINQLEKKNEDLTTRLELYEQITHESIDCNSLPEHSPTMTLKGHRRGVLCVVFHPQLLLLASCSEDGLIMIWDYKKGSQPEYVLREHTDAVHYLDFASTGVWLASCSSDANIKIWRCAGFTCYKTLYGHDNFVSCIQFFPDNEKLLSSSKDKTIKLWDIHTGECLQSYHTDWCHSIAIVPNNNANQFIGGNHNRTISIWDINKSSPEKSFEAHDHVIECIVFGSSKMHEMLLQKQHFKKFNTLMGQTPNLCVLFSASRDKTIKMWNLYEAECLQKFEGHTNWVKSITIHPAGEMIASCSDDCSICVWGIFSGKCLRKIEKAHRLFIACVRFHPRSNLLVSCGVDSLIHVWECQSKKKNENDI